MRNNQLKNTWSKVRHLYLARWLVTESAKGWLDLQLGGRRRKRGSMCVAIEPGTTAILPVRKQSNPTTTTTGAGATTRCARWCTMQCQCCSPIRVCDFSRSDFWSDPHHTCMCLNSYTRKRDLSALSILTQLKYHRQTKFKNADQDMGGLEKVRGEICDDICGSVCQHRVVTNRWN